MNMKFCRKLMMVQMIPHVLIGHPVAAILTRINYKYMAEYIHWRTLPKRARKKFTIKQIRFDHHPSLFWADFLFAPIAHILGVFGFYYLAHKFFIFGPIEAVTTHAIHKNFVEWGKLKKKRG